MNQTSQVSSLSLFDKHVERSLYNIVPSRLRPLLDEAQRVYKPLFDMDERDLYKSLVKIEQTPSITDNRLRLKFWIEYDRIQANGDKEMDINGMVVPGVCSPDFFYKHYVKNPAKLAWIICPPTSYEIKTREALEFGLEELRDILSQPHVTDRGAFIADVARVKVNIVKLLDARVKGAPVQKTMNVHGHVIKDYEHVASKMITATEEASMEELEKKLDRAQKRFEQLKNGGTLDDIIITATKEVEDANRKAAKGQSDPEGDEE